MYPTDQANGLHQGVYHCELATLQQGQWEMVKGSRGQLPLALSSHSGLQVGHITVDLAMLVQRLTWQKARNARGNPSTGRASERLCRAVWGY